MSAERHSQKAPDGGLVVISAPSNPFRCPPGPYERASLIAWYLKAKKPKSKLIILDAKDAFSKQRLFQSAWAALYPDLIEWVPLSSGGKVTSVDPATLTVSTDFASYKAAVANVIPAQRAAGIAVPKTCGFCGSRRDSLLLTAGCCSSALGVSCAMAPLATPRVTAAPTINVRVLFTR